MARRKSLRWHKHDYAGDAAYFITICTHDRQCVFGDVVDGTVCRTRAGDIVDACWRAIPTHFPEATLDIWIVMPNHLHGIIGIGAGLMNFTVGADHGRPLPAPARRDLGTVIRLFKASAMKEINEVRETRGMSLWQRGYHDHIIRDRADLARVRAYVEANPARWAEDEQNPGKIVA